MAGELAVPVWAERTTPTTWHPGHIAERYGLFTIIVLGESILAATIAVEEARALGDLNLEIAGIIVGGLLIVLSMWWIYFTRNTADLLTSFRRAFAWGYVALFRLLRRSQLWEQESQYRSIMPLTTLQSGRPLPEPQWRYGRDIHGQAFGGFTFGFERAAWPSRSSRQGLQRSSC